MQISDVLNNVLCNPLHGLHLARSRSHTVCLGLVVFPRQIQIDIGRTLSRFRVDSQKSLKPASKCDHYSFPFAPAGSISISLRSSSIGKGFLCIFHQQHPSRTKGAPGKKKNLNFKDNQDVLINSLSVNMAVCDKVHCSHHSNNYHQ